MNAGTMPGILLITSGKKALRVSFGNVRHMPKRTAQGILWFCRLLFQSFLYLSQFCLVGDVNKNCEIDRLIILPANTDHTRLKPDVLTVLSIRAVRETGSPLKSSSQWTAKTSRFFSKSLRYSLFPGSIISSPKKLHKFKNYHALENWRTDPQVRV